MNGAFVTELIGAQRKRRECGVDTQRRSQSRNAAATVSVGADAGCASRAANTTNDAAALRFIERNGKTAVGMRCGRCDTMVVANFIGAQAQRAQGFAHAQCACDLINTGTYSAQYSFRTVLS